LPLLRRSTDAFPHALVKLIHVPIIVSHTVSRDLFPMVMIALQRAIKKVNSGMLKLLS